MPLLLAFSMLAGLSAPSSDPMVAPAAVPGGCWVEPLRLSLPELAATGELERRLTNDYCLRRPGASFVRHLNRRFTVGETRFGSVKLFGEKLGVGVDVVVQPGVLGRPDLVYAVPALDLPPSWDHFLSTATYPVLLVGGTAMVTYVILELVGEQASHSKPQHGAPGR